MSPFWPLLYLMPVVLACGAPPSGEDSPAAQRRRRAFEFHVRAQEPTGVLVPMYVYPADGPKNPAYKRLIELKRRYETVPMWIIVNPASGPGAEADGNYTQAIDRLCGAGCVVIGYVTTSYGKRTVAEVSKDVDQWLTLYPRIQGIFFDEMTYEDTDAAAQYQANVNRYAHHAGFWPTVANPGTDTPGRYFAADAADVIIVHEGERWPKEEVLRGDFFGGYSDYPPFTRGVLLHSQPRLDVEALRMARKYARWVYVTEGVFRAGDPRAANPWDRVSKHLDQICEQLSGR